MASLYNKYSVFTTNEDCNKIKLKIEIYEKEIKLECIEIKLK